MRRIGVTLALVAGAAAVPAVSSSASAASNCRAWAFIGIAGSGQGKTHNGSSSTDNALYGPQVAMVKQAFVAKKGAANVALYPINYPAYNAGSNLGLLVFGGIGAAVILASYNNSVAKGVTETKRIISNVAKSCPNTRFVISGYSQGAHVATNTLGSFPVATSKMYRAALMGNPRFRDGSTNSVEVPAGSVTKSGIFNGGANWLSTWNGKVRDVCIDKDTFCEGLSATNFTAHGAYTTKNYPNTSVKIPTYLGRTWLGG
ncbi:MAG TPA: cutinase family protein [Ilumatobacter sp.]|nr:cutinase family protein [Ilumatobacter sp.]